MTVVITIGMFALCMAGLGLGVLLSNRELAGSCGGAVDAQGEPIASCGACAKKEAEVCPSDDAFVALAQISHPNPKHRH